MTTMLPAEPGNESRLLMKIHKRHEVILSVDLGKSQDFTAYTAVEATPKTITNLAGNAIRIIELDVLNIQRLPLGTDYTDVAAHIREVYRDPRLWRKGFAESRPTPPTLIMDAGGVGDGVYDIVERYMGIKPIRYKLVRGTSRVRRHNSYNWTVPRPYIFDLLDGSFGSDRIIVDPRLRLAKELIGELQRLKGERDEETGNVRVTHREGDHDDLGIVLAAANWWANKETKGNHALRLVR